MIKVDRRDFRVCLKAVLPHVSTDPSRGQLHRIHVTRDGQDLTMTATNGHTLCLITMSCQADDDAPTGFVRAFTPTQAKGWRSECAKGDESIALALGEAVQDLPPLESLIPDYLPEGCGNDLPIICFTTPVLEAVVKTGAAIIPKDLRLSNPFRFQFDGCLNPVRMDMKYRDLRVMIVAMPARGPASQ